MALVLSCSAGLPQTTCQAVNQINRLQQSVLDAATRLMYNAHWCNYVKWPPRWLFVSERVNYRVSSVCPASWHIVLFMDLSKTICPATSCDLRPRQTLLRHGVMSTLCHRTFSVIATWFRNNEIMASKRVTEWSHCCSTHPTVPRSPSV